MRGGEGRRGEVEEEEVAGEEEGSMVEERREDGVEERRRWSGGEARRRWSGGEVEWRRCAQPYIRHSNGAPWAGVPLVIFLIF